MNLTHAYWAYSRPVELDAALEYADFSKSARIILRFVLGQIYGLFWTRGDQGAGCWMGGIKGELGVVELSLIEISVRLGRSKQSLSRGLRELKTSNVLLEVRPKYFRFNPNYGDWVAKSKGDQHPMTPQLSHAEIEECRSSPEYFRHIMNTFLDSSNPKDR